MKSKKKLGLRIRTIRDLDRVTGGAGAAGTLDERLAGLWERVNGGLGKENTNERTCTTHTTSDDNRCPCTERRDWTCPPPEAYDLVLKRFKF